MNGPCYGWPVTYTGGHQQQPAAEARFQSMMHFLFRIHQIMFPILNLLFYLFLILYLAKDMGLQSQNTATNIRTGQLRHTEESDNDQIHPSKEGAGSQRSPVKTSRPWLGIIYKVTTDRGEPSYEPYKITMLPACRRSKPNALCPKFFFLIIYFIKDVSLEIIDERTYPQFKPQ